MKSSRETCRISEIPRINFATARMTANAGNMRYATGDARGLWVRRREIISNRACWRHLLDSCKSRQRPVITAGPAAAAAAAHVKPADLTTVVITIAR